MSIEYALICWARWVVGDWFPQDSAAIVQRNIRLKASEIPCEQAVDEAVVRLPEDLYQIIKLFYLERQRPVYCQEALGLDQENFRLRLKLAKQLIAFAVFTDISQEGLEEAG